MTVLLRLAYFAILYGWLAVTSPPPYFHLIDAAGKPREAHPPVIAPDAERSSR